MSSTLQPPIDAFAKGETSRSGPPWAQRRVLWDVRRGRYRPEAAMYTYSRRQGLFAGISWKVR